jgi:hypothetical protein
MLGEIFTRGFGTRVGSLTGRGEGIRSAFTRARLVAAR